MSGRGTRIVIVQGGELVVSVSTVHSEAARVLVGMEEADVISACRRYKDEEKYELVIVKGDQLQVRSTEDGVNAAQKAVGGLTEAEVLAACREYKRQRGYTALMRTSRALARMSVLLEDGKKLTELEMTITMVGAFQEVADKLERALLEAEQGVAFWKEFPPGSYDLRDAEELDKQIMLANLVASSKREQANEVSALGEFALAQGHPLAEEWSQVATRFFDFAQRVRLIAIAGGKFHANAVAQGLSVELEEKMSQHPDAAPTPDGSEPTK